MSHQFRLRLRDGTVLAVDYDGLRTWLLDDRAMAQRSGSSRWFPLKEVVAAGRPAIVAPPRAPAPPPPVVKREAEVPASSPSAARPGEGLPLIPLEAVEEDVPLRDLAVAPLAEATPPQPPTRTAELPVIPFKLDEDEAPFRLSVEAEVAEERAVEATPEVEEREDERVERVPAGQSLLDVASAELERHIAGDRPWQWSAPDPRRTPLGAGAAAPTAARPESGQGDELLPELDFVEEDGGVPAPPLGQAFTHAVTEGVTRLAGSVGRLTERANRVMRSVGRLRGWAGRLVTGVAGLTRSVRQAASPTPADSAGPWAASLPRAELRKPPPSTGELPVLRLAPMEKEARELYEGESAVGRMWPWLKRAAVIAGLVAVAVAAAATARTWMPTLTRLAQVVFGPNDKPTTPAGPSLPSGEQNQPQVPMEVRVAASQLPHLAPVTVQLVMSSEYGTADPPELFRRAHTAANRGARALTAPEAEELGKLERAVLAPLRPVDRERLRAYDRVTVGRYLLSGEDAKVLALYARGVRALPRQGRERLQELYGKAVAAALAPGTRPAGAASEAPATR